MRAARSLAPIALMVAAVACSLRAPHLTESVCNQDSQCRSGQVCFANACRSPASALQSVVLEVTPPTSSSFAPVQRALDLRASAVSTVDLPLPSRLQGTVVQDRDADGGTPAAVPVGGAALSFQAAQALLPGRAFLVTAQTDSSGGFSVRLADAAFRVLILPPAPLPPFSADVPDRGAQDLTFRLPAPGTLARVSGVLKSGGAPLAGARVTPVDRSGVALGAAASADASGRFQLLLPPPPVEYAVRIGDATDGGASFAGGPIPSFAADALTLRTATATSSTIELDVGALPAPATLTGKVVDLGGAPLAGVRVTAVTDAATGFILTRSVLSAADGSFQLGLREGHYVVEAAPALDPDAPALSGERGVDVRTGAVVVLTCGPKARAAGKVLRSGGRALGAGAAVTATRLPDRLAGGRAATTTSTDATGSYTLVGDPGTYRVEVVPSPESGEPRQLAYLQVGTPLPGGATADLEPIELSPALVIAGLVRGPNGTSTVPVAGASVEVFAINGAGDGAVHLGSAVTDAAGKYKLVLPDVSQPAAPLPAR